MDRRFVEKNNLDLKQQEQTIVRLILKAAQRKAKRLRQAKNLLSYVPNHIHW